MTFNRGINAAFLGPYNNADQSLFLSYECKNPGSAYNGKQMLLIISDRGIGLLDATDDTWVWTL